MHHAIQLSEFLSVTAAWCGCSPLLSKIDLVRILCRAELNSSGILLIWAGWCSWQKYEHCLNGRDWIRPPYRGHDIGGDKPSGIWGLVFTTRPILFCLKKHLIHHPRGENILPLLLLRETSHYLCFRNMSPVRKPPHTIHCFKCLTESLMLFLFFVFSSEYSHFSNVLCLQT